MSSRCGRSRTAKACVAVSHPPRFTNATAQRRHQTRYKYDLQRPFVNDFLHPHNHPTRPQKPLAIHSDHSTPTHPQRHPRIIQHAIPLRPHQYHRLRWHRFGQPRSFASTSRQAHWRPCFGFSHSVFRTGDMCRPQHRESCRMPVQQHNDNPQKNTDPSSASHRRRQPRRRQNSLHHRELVRDRQHRKLSSHLLPMYMELMSRFLTAIRWSHHCKHDGHSQDWHHRLLHPDLHPGGLWAHSSKPVPWLPLQWLVAW